MSGNLGVVPLPDTERVAFSPISLADADVLFEVWSAPEVTEFLLLDPFVSVDEAKAMIGLLAGLPESDGGRRWTMREKASGRIMGTLGFHNVKREHRRAEIGYEMAQVFWGKGLMSEAMGPLLAYCFELEDMNRIEAFVTAGNERSCQVLRRAGFSEEGTLRQYEFGRGRFMDQVIFSLLRSEWAAGAGLRSSFLFQ